MISWTYIVLNQPPVQGPTATSGGFIALKDWRIDPATGDMDLTSKRATLIDGVDAIAQRLRIRLGFWLGEWFLDTRQGFPFIQNVAGQKRPNMRLIERLYRRAILGCPGVSKIISFSISVVAKTRTAAIKFKVKVEGGATVAFLSSPTPFIVPLAA